MKKFSMSTTGVVVLTTLIVLGLFDLYMVVFKGVGSSISNFVVETGQYSPVFTFVSGVVTGHLFLPMKEKDSHGK